MNLRELAEADNAIILEDDVSGFAVAIKMTDPSTEVAGVKARLTVHISGGSAVTIPAGTVWLVEGERYLQDLSVTLTTDPEGHGHMHTHHADAALTAEAVGVTAATVGSECTMEVHNPNIDGTTVSTINTPGVDYVPATSWNVKGQYIRKGVDIDPETGLLVPGNSSGVTVRLSSLGAGVLPDDGWLIETTDITGASVKGKATGVMLDRTAGRATMIMRK